MCCESLSSFDEMDFYQNGYDRDSNSIQAKRGYLIILLSIGALTI